ncbi:3-hydroxybutyryl-CoA dehydrogenase [Solirubrobacter ginsenosidimutans]|uniref:3-hydroxybutyryl-CoA dehydrogenase n=1 Tax=Solirubrobacter ginsenosidimutans TaxID=490573 RepID=A0A9X3S543_9ACTN|nr:3-hydroxybutyryl-CoA dehydrogenase [Solirubrobacter ginsenosidimutans]MDA0161248.1 3-hydroxybutyryl-CoA dehydrogenase [Solirubrobacter ginsenosidimutans]
MRVGVIGGGLMGSGIAEVCARSGVDVTVVEADDERAERSRAAIERSLARAVRSGKLDEAGQAAALEHLAVTSTFEDIAGSDAAIEAVVEDEQLKRDVFKRLDDLLPDAKFLASNTSSVPIMKLGAGTKHPGRVLGMHFFNPVPVLPLVELVTSIMTEPETVEAVREFAEGTLGKQCIDSQDRAGFVVNALLIPYLLSAIRMYESGFASKEDIDHGMVLGCAHPMGPLRLSDLIGLDTLLAVSESLYDEFRDPASVAPALLNRMVEAGLLGRKSGRGFYDYSK